ncbi:MAG: class I mannose-6-phosphate isomerase [Kiritimatiellaeota bacterium]|nr:class I mannose-6-phosphate isomerase [Kiritimatiellota bacterium]
MNMEPKALRFAPVYKSYPWGGTRLPARYQRADAPEVCAESWEISGHPKGMGVVAAGPYAGMTLDALARRFGAQLTGRPLETFPLIFKILNARGRLSLQVHPSDATARAFGGEPKSEAWHMLGPGVIYTGLRDGVTEADLRDARTDRDFENLLLRHDVAEGDSVYIPGGLVHAIGEGSLVYEIQQSSDTTYRLYDWGNNGRETHVEEGLRVVDWSLGAPKIIKGRAGCEGAPPSPCPPGGLPIPKTFGNPSGGGQGTARPTLGWREILRTPYFHLRGITLADEPLRVEMPGDTFHALFVKRGAARVEAGGETTGARCGDSLLLPACCGAYTLAPEGGAEILLTTL